jgi:hypothetical protein
MGGAVIGPDGMDYRSTRRPSGNGRAGVAGSPRTIGRSLGWTATSGFSPFYSGGTVSFITYYG